MSQQPRGSVGLPRSWGKADLHVHTRLSDGGPTPEQVVEHVLSRTDLDVVAITDHNRIEGGLRVRDAAARRGLQIVLGEEVGTRDGHLLALFIERRLPPGRPMAETVAEVHAQGGLAIAAHPYDWMSSSLLGRGAHHWTVESVLALQLDGLETLNASLVRHVANTRAEHLAQRLSFTTVGGSDAHHLAVIGRAYTRFPGRTPEDLREAILAGTAAADGCPWRWQQYLSWLSGCLIPRAIRRARAVARPRVLA